MLANLTNLNRLNFEGTSLKEMPLQMSSMKHSKRLSNSVLGKDDGSNIKELLARKDLQRSLYISSLQNVANVNDVSKIALKNMKYFD